MPSHTNLAQFNACFEFRSAKNNAYRKKTVEINVYMDMERVLIFTTFKL